MKFLYLFQILALVTIISAQNPLVQNYLTIETSSPDQIRSLFSNGSKFTGVSSSLLNLQGNLTAHARKNEDLSGIILDAEIYLRIRAHDLEFIICDIDTDTKDTKKIKESSLTSWRFLQTNSELKKDIIQKGFVAKVGNQSCQGKIYYTKEDSAAIQQINSLVESVFTESPLKFDNFVKSFNKDTIAFIKIAKPHFFKIHYEILNLPATFLTQSKNWDKVETSGKDYKIFHAGDKEKTFTNVRIVALNTQEKSHINALTTLQGAGLHQKITKVLSVEGNKVSFAKNKTCNILLVDSLTDQTYVDQDEIRYTEYLKLKRFDVLDIEKPTETARQHLWIAQASVGDLTKRSGNDNELNVEYPVHFRYRNPGNEAYAESQLFLRTKFFTDCNLTTVTVHTESDFYGEKVRELFGKQYQEIPLRHFVSEGDLKQGNVSESIPVKVPIGDSKIITPVTIVTLSISILGALAVLYFMLNSTKPKLD